MLNRFWSFFGYRAAPNDIGGSIYNGFDADALALAKNIYDTGFYQLVAAAKSTWAGVAEQTIRFRREVVGAGAIETSNGVVSFDKADYFLEINKKGDCAYHVKLQEGYFPVNVESITDPEIRAFHGSHIKEPTIPLLRLAK